MDYDKNKYKVTCGIPFKDRLDILSNTILSVIWQSNMISELILVDDSDKPTDLRELPQYQSIFYLLNYYNIEWTVLFGRKMGQHHSHQMVQEKAKYPIIWRIDSDEIAQGGVLQGLLDCLADDVGAVGGLVPQDCPMHPLPQNAANIITDLSRPNIQWFKHPTRKASIIDSEKNKDKAFITELAPNNVEVDHLTSSFIYRKGIAKYELSLSPAAFREETLFTYEIKRKGYKLIVNPNVITWHFRSSDRHQNTSDWESDDRLFNSKLQEWGVSGDKTKYIVLDCGKGDHVIVKSLIPRLKKKYDKIIVASCFPDVFVDDNVEQISIAEAQKRLGNLERFNIYRHCIDLNHKTELVHAFESLYGI